MPDLDDPTDVDDTDVYDADVHDADVYDTDDDLLRRPLPPRTWRDRLDELAAGGGTAGRVVAAVAVLVVVGAVGWRLLAPPASPPEMEIPLAEPAAGGGADPARDAAAGVSDDVAPSGSSDPAGSPAVGAAAPGGANAAGGAGEAGAAGEVVVHVVGAVVAPGVQRLPAGSRVIDAVERAGGAGGDADLARLNLAAPLADGQQVYVLRIGEVAPMPPVGAGAGADGSPAGDAAGGLVDINRATAAELEELPGVGPATAEAIIVHREQNGPFTSVDDLIDVRGIGDAKLEQIRPQATV